jgi:hypothetical protein
MPKDKPCPKCKSTNTYYDDDGMMACLKCAERFPFSKTEPISVNPKITKQEKIEMSEVKIPSSGKKGICSNCGRDRWICNKHGHCGTCASAVKGFEHGTPEFDAALAAAKKRIQANGDAKFNKVIKCLRSRAKERIDEIRQLPSEKKATKQLENLTVTDVMKAERDLLLDRVQRLNTAIELLS